MNYELAVKDKIQRGIALENEICKLIKENIDVYSKIIKNVYIESSENKKTEIDIILITAYGIYVIESKNFRGTIVGKENEKNWNVIYSPKYTQDTYNYIDQNKKHINALKDYLEKIEDDFKSYIVLGKETKHNIEYDENKTTIININELIEHLIDNMHNSEMIFSHEEIDKIYIDLKYYCEHCDVLRLF